MKLELSGDLKGKVENFTPLQKSYCHYRAKGLSQSAAAKAAGSTAEDKAYLSRIGHQIETVDGAKEYIELIKGSRSTTAIIDELEILHMLKAVYDEAMKLSGKSLKDANTSIELMATVIGIIGKGAVGRPIGSTNALPVDSLTKTDAFKEDREGSEDNETTERISKLQQMLKDLNRGDLKDLEGKV